MSRIVKTPEGKWPPNNTWDEAANGPELRKQDELIQRAAELLRYEPHEDDVSQHAADWEWERKKREWLKDAGLEGK